MLYQKSDLSKNKRGGHAQHTPTGTQGLILGLMRDALKNTLLFLFAKLEILSYITIYENVATQRIIFICIDIQNFLLHMYRYMNFIYVHIRQFAFHMS